MTDELRDYFRFMFSSPWYWGPVVLALVSVILSVLALCGVGT